MLMSGINSRLIQTHIGSDIDLEKLKTEFKLHCTDYKDDIGNGKSKALEFCEKIVYEIGPKSRKEKKDGKDEYWKFSFKNEVKTQDEVKIDEHTVFVFLSEEKKAQYEHSVGPREMVLTVKEAGLIIHDTFEKAIKLAYVDGIMMLTPLAEVCFSREDIPLLATELEVEELDLLVMLNQSAQSGGHYLPHSDVNIAICISIFTSRNLRDKQRKIIVENVVKPYISKGQYPDKDKVVRIASYLDYCDIIEQCEDAHIFEVLQNIFEIEQTKYSAFKMAEATKQLEIMSIIEAPQSDLTVCHE